MHYAASTLFIFHRRLRILSHWYSCAFREHILKSELTSAMQSVVGVALLRKATSGCPRRHALCSLHTIHLSQKIANLVTLVFVRFPRTYPKKRTDERYAVGRRRRSAPPHPGCPRRHALCSLHTIHLSQTIANLVTLVFVRFPRTYPKSELTSAMQSVVGVALLRHTRLPRRHALCSLHTIHLFTDDCESCHIGIRALSATIY